MVILKHVHATSVHASAHTWMHYSAIESGPILSGGTVGLWDCGTVRPSFWSASGTVGQRDSGIRRAFGLGGFSSPTYS